MKKLTNKLSVFFKTSGKSIIISLCTGAAFLLLGTVQLLLVILTPVGRTFDHIALIVLDYFIVLFCVVYILYKKGRLDELIRYYTKPDHAENADSEISSDQETATEQGVAQAVFQPQRQVNSAAAGVRNTPQPQRQVNSDASAVRNSPSRMHRTHPGTDTVRNTPQPQRQINPGTDTVRNTPQPQRQTAPDAGTVRNTPQPQRQTAPDAGAVRNTPSRMHRANPGTDTVRNTPRHRTAGETAGINRSAQEPRRVQTGQTGGEHNVRSQRARFNNHRSDGN